MRDRAALVLEDGRIFEGESFGAPLHDSAYQKDKGYGEICFNTGMTGYQEILTDPSYFGQMICMTHPHIGNTGINDEDVESARLWCAGMLIHQLTDRPSNWRSKQTLEEYLKRHGVPGLKQVDTRALTRHLRDKGALRGIFLPIERVGEAKTWLKKLPAFEGRDLIKEVTTRERYSWPRSAAETPPPRATRFRVVALDFGIKSNLMRELQAIGAKVEVVSATTSAEDILAMKPSGVFLSNGPGDPTAAPYVVATVKELLGKLPCFGVCMGHQILALALGGKTYKLKFGHHGSNQPVQDNTTRRVKIASHNHGYAVAPDSLPPDVTVSFTNLNDDTVAGLNAPQLRAFSVQYHPEASPGPRDSYDLFERFAQSMGEFKN